MAMTKEDEILKAIRELGRSQYSGRDVVTWGKFLLTIAVVAVGIIGFFFDLKNDTRNALQLARENKAIIADRTDEIMSVKVFQKNIDKMKGDIEKIKERVYQWPQRPGQEVHR